MPLKIEGSQEGIKTLFIQSYSHPTHPLTHHNHIQISLPLPLPLVYYTHTYRSSGPDSPRFKNSARPPHLEIPKSPISLSIYKSICEISPSTENQGLSVPHEPKSSLLHPPRRSKSLPNLQGEDFSFDSLENPDFCFHFSPTQRKIEPVPMSIFSVLPDDVTLNVILKLQDDPRDWARLACVSTKFSSIVRNVFWKNKCSQTIPSIVSDLLFTPANPTEPPGGWASLHKLCVCCPGLLHAGVLLENSDFGLERELGSDEIYQQTTTTRSTTTTTTTHVPESPLPASSSNHHDCSMVSASENGWSLFDDLYFDTVYDVSESQDEPMSNVEEETDAERVVVKVGKDFSACRKRKKQCSSVGIHLTSGAWELSREEGSKLLAARFRGDVLYICKWPGCVHTEEKRTYNLFRGIFKNFKRSQVWRTINDGNDGKRSKIALDCAFCPCKETWDLHTAFCLRRVFGYHDDGEPVVRAYVCENGHVSGAWTDRPLYT